MIKMLKYLGRVLFLGVATLTWLAIILGACMVIAHLVAGSGFGVNIVVAIHLVVLVMIVGVLMSFLDRQ